MAFSVCFHTTRPTARTLPETLDSPLKRDNLVRFVEIRRHARLEQQKPASLTFLFAESVLSVAFSALTLRLSPRLASHLLRTLPGALLLAAAAVSPARANWPAPPSSLVFESPYGTLSVETSEYIYESRLYLNQAPVQPALQGLLDITYAYEINDAHAALVAVSDGNAQCAVRYHWVVLKRNGYRVSPALGSCSKRIKVTAKGAQLILATPNPQDGGKVDVYTYDGNSVKKRTRAATVDETVKPR